ncbi:hypothetical protein [Geopsychrobacter electrodiphilus]|uniref:hypothetical protein n=1 Tax=Geopsychrobacter electrodiphilus TaxID=225196 RepID=UPI00037C1FF5|nr:hypothetical protein [Geopsychrobacter electrodiphilus]
MSQSLKRTQLWQQLVSQIQAEYIQLPEAEKGWIHSTCLNISALQLELDQLFQRGDGPQQCSDCRGDCCELGHNHLTLANLLLLLSQEIPVPTLDYKKTCPLLGDQGCLLTPQQRPYACISFLCDRLEPQLSPDQISHFYALEAELRRLYYAFSRRYAGGGMSGLLLVAGRLQGQPFLRRIDTV